MEVHPLPSVIIVMGVSGSGKTTVAAMLAGRLGWEYGDADDFHSPANVRKMHGGMPLTDEDRLPWLTCMAAWIDATRAVGRHGVLACSALKRSYREVLVGTRTDVRLVYLRGDKALITGRQAARHNHFMPVTLVDSQFATLEEPGEDEQALTVSVAPSPPAIVDTIAEAIRPLAIQA
jgi:carbohydrate kinase (thermoresistant glucokinase family)